MSIRLCTRSIAALAAIAAALWSTPQTFADEIVPAASVGHWSGSASAGGSTYSVSIDLKADGSATVTYGAPYNCAVSWKLVSHAGGFLGFDERVAHPGVKACRDGAMVTLVADSTGKSIVYHWSSAAAGTSATAVLHREP